MTGITEESKVVAQREFDLIQDLLRTPLREDLSDKAFPDRRRWSGGCLPSLPRADLVPFNLNPCAGPSGFCSLVDNSKEKQLRVTIKNQGTAKAVSSFTKVIFYPIDIKFPKYIKELTTSEIQADGGTTNVDFSFDQGYLEQGFNFEIFVNSGSNVLEYNTDNNHACGSCGPSYSSIKHSGKQV
jgi:hypothetical protein